MLPVTGGGEPRIAWLRAMPGPRCSYGSGKPSFVSELGPLNRRPGELRTGQQTEGGLADSVIGLRYSLVNHMLRTNEVYDTFASGAN